MTQTSLPQEARDNQFPKPTSAPDGPSNSLYLAPEAASDNDASERPVREQLKKTSINNISQRARAMNVQEGILGPYDDSAAEPASIQRDSSPGIESGKTEADSIRGRPVKKRSFDDLEAADLDRNTPEVNGSSIDRANCHVRKRSRDVRTNEPAKSDKQPRAATTTLEEEVEDTSSHTELPESRAVDVEGLEAIVGSSPDIVHGMEVDPAQDVNDYRAHADDTSQELGPDHTDREMLDTASDPRKKRSRDHFDTEADREQKIPATEGARAQRRSDELDRTETREATDEGTAAPEVPMASEEVPHHAAESSHSTKSGQETVKEAPQLPSESTPVLEPPIRSTRSSSPMKTSNDTKHQKSELSFASSGFAAHSNSATSPFGALGASSTSVNTSSPFSRPAPVGPTNSESINDIGSTKSDSSPNGGFSTFAKGSSAGFGATEPSPFAASGAPKSGVFGGSVFGGGFGGGFGGSGKLTNFAAPVGNTKLGTANGTIKPIGSPARDGDEEDENSDEEGEGEVLGENENDGSDEVDDRFQYQNVETGEDDERTIFSSRASLYTFRDKAWKEGGKGTFKFNVNASSADDTDPSLQWGRFIMRAHQTFRVLLNAPVLKRMTVGDGKGKEPNGKSFSFGVVEDGLLVPHLLKLSDTAESKTLFREVKRLQDSMPEA